MPSVGGGHDDYLDDYSSDDYYAGDNDDYLSVEEKVVHTTPTFVSSSSSQMVNEGDTIKLPCFVDKLGKKIELIRMILQCLATKQDFLALYVVNWHFSTCPDKC